MTPEEFAAKIWAMYPNDLCHKKKGTRFNAQKACDKVKESEYKRIIMNVDALIKFDRNEYQPDRWPHVSTFINQGYYDREIGSVAEQREKSEERFCNKEGCNYPVIGPRYSCCHLHLPSVNDKKAEMLKEAYKAMTIDRAAPDFAGQCKAYAREKGFIF